MAAWNLITPPAVEPVALDEAKLHLRVDHNDEDTLIDNLITVARQQVEHHTRRALITQEWELILSGWPYKRYIEVPLPPLQSVDPIRYYDTDDTEHTLDAAEYTVEPEQLPGRITLNHEKTWPSITLRPARPIVVEFTAGYGDNAADVPQAIKQAILLNIGHLYENRELVVVGTAVTPIPFVVDALLASYRVWGW